MKKRREASFSSVRGSSVSPGAGFGKGGSAGALERQKERIEGLGESRGGERFGPYPHRHGLSSLGARRRLAEVKQPSRTGSAPPERMEAA